MIRAKKGCYLLLIVITLILLMLPGSVTAAYSRVITFGADLNRGQKNILAAEFGVNLAETGVPVVDVTNAEERRYLEGLVPEEVIGTRAISSTLVEMLPAGQGIKVETRNITWVTNDMYANALATARVKDARILVAAPFPVSGTAALTGIFKAFEHATGKSLGDRFKKTANEELVRTGNLGREIGKDKASKLILLVKERVVAEKAKDPERIRQIIINVAGDLNITLTDRQVDEITVLMRKISGLNLEARDLSGQLKSLKTDVERALAKQPEFRTWLERLLDALSRLIEEIRTLILREK